MLTSRGVALQGVGLSALALALQGLIGGDAPPLPPWWQGGFTSVFLPAPKLQFTDAIEDEEALLIAHAI
jgi:hypothetical protein